MAVSKDFADYCCELLSGVGNPTAKRMFGGFAVYVEDASIAWLLDLNKDNNAKLFSKPAMRRVHSMKPLVANALCTT